MLGLSAFRRKPRQFEYKPRFFDPEKDAREERKKMILGEDYSDTPDEAAKEYVAGQYIRRHMRARRGWATEKSHGRRQRVTRRAVILLIFLIVLAIVLFVR